MSCATSKSRLISASCATAIFIGSIVLTINHDWVDRPLAKYIDGLAKGRQLAALAAFCISYPALQGVTVVSLLWAAWFSCANTEEKARLSSGIIAAILAALASSVLQQFLPASPKPIFDAALGFHPAVILGDASGLASNASQHSFPSERATLFAGLGLAAVFVRREFGLLALALSLATEAARIYLGLHYLSDIVGSMSLAGSAVLIAQFDWSVRYSMLFVRLERVSPPIFYMLAFILTYLLSTAFQDLREIAALLRR